MTREWLRTSVNLDPRLYRAVKASGVRSFSKHVRTLLLNDLAERVGVANIKKGNLLGDELTGVRQFVVEELDK